MSRLRLTHSRVRLSIVLVRQPLTKAFIRRLFLYSLIIPPLATLLKKYPRQTFWISVAQKFPISSSNCFYFFLPVSFMANVSCFMKRVFFLPYAIESILRSFRMYLKLARIFACSRRHKWPRTHFCIIITAFYFRYLACSLCRAWFRNSSISYFFFSSYNCFLSSSLRFICPVSTRIGEVDVILGDFASMISLLRRDCCR